MTFQELGLIKPVLKALAEQGYEKPSPIQEKAIPPALALRDVLGCAQTGTGKTCAFAAPILQTLSASKASGRPIRSLVLTPTRELALQIQESFEAYGAHLALRSAVIFGGVGQQPQVDKLKRGVDILVATPGRLLDLHGQGFLDFSGLEILVLDEADRMLDMGFIHDVRRILKLLPEKKQTLFFSATMPPEITELVDSLLKNPVKVAVDPVSSPVEVIEQSVYLVDKGNKSRLLAALMDELGARNALVFTRTKHGANKVAADLEKAGVSAAAIHGNKSQTARQQALSDFKSGKVRCLVATDIAARGLDIEELSHVFNYNLPEVPETYVHRIGRTGRAGRGGVAISFCDFAEKQYLKDIERLIGRKITVVEDHSWPMEIFEAPRDSRGRTVNADDAEARAAAKERRRAKDAANRARAAERKAQTAAPEEKKGQPSAPEKKDAAGGAVQKNGRKGRKKTASGPENKPMQAEEKPAEASGEKKSHRGVRRQKLEDTIPAAPQKAQSDFCRPNPLDGDVILDATARLLAPRSRPSAPKQTEKDGQGASAGKGKGLGRRGGRQAKPAGAEAAPPRDAAPAEKNTQPPTEKRRSQSRGHGRRGGPPEVSLRGGGQKDSTEQPSLMKPYYFNPHDD